MTDKDVISQAIQQAQPDGALVGWVMIAEFINEKGERSLKRIDCNASGDALPDWVRSGYLHDALFSAAWEDQDDVPW